MALTIEGGTVADSSGVVPRRGLGRADGWLADRAFRTLSVAAGITVLVILGLIIVSTTGESLPAFRESGLSFFTSDRWAPNDDAYGALAFIYGTAVISAVALVLAVPASIGIALFTVEVVPRRVRNWVTTGIDLLAAIPSVVYGLWGILVLAPAVVGFYDNIAGWVAPVPGLRVIFAEGASGRSFMTAGVVLAIMVIPIVTSITREVITMVPSGDREAAVALGSTRWEMIKGAVLPRSFGGIVGAVMLGLGRAMGETIAIALTIGSSNQIIGSLFEPGVALPEGIVQQWGESSSTHRSALVALGVVLFAMTIMVNVLARGIVGRTERALRGS